VSDYHARGWLDDRAGSRLVAEQWARQGYASAAIRVKLAAKGFDARIIDETVARVVPSSDDEARARTMLAKRAPQLADRSARARLARTLAAHGFEPDVIERLLGQSFDPDDAQR
jgi:SOS response regulatory protein OraA/RecX